MNEIVKGKKEIQRLLMQEEDACTAERSPEQLVFAVNYLSFFGYITVELLKNVSLDDVYSGIKQFQKWFELKSDGIVGPKTLRAMEAPRCGCLDVPDTDNGTHVQFMRISELVADKKAGWSKHGLTYAVESYPDQLMSKTAQLKIFSGAFKAWSDICGLTITPIKSVKAADLVLSTGSGKLHKFDGRGGTLAWAYVPDGNDRQLTMRFDLAETWTMNPVDRGILLFNVACHEFGHMLGLSHSKMKGALMAPFYNPNIAVPQQVDDIPNMLHLYGQPVPPAVPIKSVIPPEQVIHIKPGQ